MLRASCMRSTTTATTRRRRACGGRRRACARAGVAHDLGMRAALVTVGLLCFGASVQAQAVATAKPAAVAATPVVGKPAGAGKAVAAKPASTGKPAVAAKPAGAAKPGLRPPWTGVFDPQLPVHAPWRNAQLTPVAHAGAVRVLTPEAGA